MLVFDEYTGKVKFIAIMLYVNNTVQSTWLYFWLTDTTQKGSGKGGILWLMS